MNFCWFNLFFSVSLYDISLETFGKFRIFLAVVSSVHRYLLC